MHSPPDFDPNKDQSLTSEKKFFFISGVKTKAPSMPCPYKSCKSLGSSNLGCSPREWFLVLSLAAGLKVKPFDLVANVALRYLLNSCVLDSCYYTQKQNNNDSLSEFNKLISAKDLLQQWQVLKLHSKVSNEIKNNKPHSTSAKWWCSHLSEPRWLFTANSSQMFTVRKCIVFFSD